MKYLGIGLSLLSAGVVGFGCSGSVVVDDGSGGASSANPSTTSAVTSTHTGNTVSVTNGSTGTGSAGCDDDKGCKDGFACIHSDNLCGKGVKGVCTAETFPPCVNGPEACLCNGTVSTPCGTEDISQDPTLCSNGTFNCGGLMCKKYLEYCVPPMASPAGGGPDQGCIPAPPACTYGIVDCGCVSNGGNCQDDGQGGVTYMFPIP